MKKEDRNKVYSHALKLIESGQMRFCCDAVRAAIHLLVFGEEWISGQDLPALDLVDFPELKAFDKNSFTWWPHDDKQSRINCLKTCIEQTNKSK